MAAFTIVVCCDLALIAGWLLASLSASAPRGAEDAVALRQVWRVPGEARGTPAVAGDLVVFLSKWHEVVAVERASGRVTWRMPTGEIGGATAGSAVRARQAVIVAGDRAVTAFDLEGRRRWRYGSDAGGSAGLYLGGIDDDRVYAGSAAGLATAIDVETGRLQWQASVAARDAIVFAPAVHRAGIVAAYADRSGGSGVVALDPVTGRERWRTRLDGYGAVRGDPLAAGDQVIVATADGTIHALDAEVGRSRRTWPPVSRRGTGEWTAQDFRALAQAGRTLVAGSLSGTVVAYDLASGRERWRRAAWRTSVAFGLATDGRLVYVPYVSGPLVVLDASTGDERARTVEGRDEFHWAPRASGGLVFAASSSRGYFAFARP